jgi:hypothetical protein
MSLRSVLAKTAALGDMVVLYGSPENMVTSCKQEPRFYGLTRKSLQWSIQLSTGAQFQCTFGLFEHNKIVGQPYGGKIFAKGNNEAWYLSRSSLSHLSHCVYKVVSATSYT